MDASRDRKHPFKKFRPVANGTLPVPIALGVSALFVILGLVIASQLGRAFFVLSVIFIVLEYTYTLFFKHITLPCHSLK